MDDDENYAGIDTAADETCRYCHTTGEAGSSCDCPSRAIECPHMDACDHKDLRRELFEEDADCDDD